MTTNSQSFAENTNPKNLEDARVKSHYAVQWLTRAARALLPAKDDDSHTNLGWDNTIHGFVTHDLPGSAGSFKVGLRIGDLSLLIIGGGEDVRVNLEGHTDAEIGTWLSGLLESRMGTPVDLSAPLPYDMPDHPLAQSGTYDLGKTASALGVLADWFGNANQVISEVAEKMSPVNPGPSPVRCWPHHFDIATLISFDTGGGEEARSVGVGLSPGDGSFAEPYYYVSPWPYPNADTLPTLPAPFHWHTDGFTAAILTGTNIVEMDAQPTSLGGLVFSATKLAASSIGAEVS